MSMTELEARCVSRAINTARKVSEIDFVVAVRAVLAEAGVDELVEALVEVRQWIDGWTPDFVQDDEWPDTAARIDAAIAKGRQ